MKKLGIAVVAAGLAAAFAPAPAGAADLCVTTFEEFGEVCTKDVVPLAARTATCVALAETPSQTVGCLPNPYGPWLP
jgi:hypothetical protein